MKRLLFLTFLIGFLSQTALSQSKWKFDFSAGGSASTGNVNHFDLKNSAGIEHNDTLYSLSACYKIIYSEDSHKETNREYSGGTKFDFRPENLFSPFVALEMLSNKHKGYDLKISGLLGAKYRIIRKKDIYDYSISAAYVFDDVNYTPQEEENQLDKTNHRLSIRPKIKQKIAKNLWINHVTFYQPSFINFNDYIINSTTTLKVKINKSFALETIFEYGYISKLPSEEYKNQDINLTFGINISL